MNKFYKIGKYVNIHVKQNTNHRGLTNLS